MHLNELPTPDSAAASAANQVARRFCSSALYAHSVRAYLWGVAYAKGADLEVDLARLAMLARASTIRIAAADAVVAERVIDVRIGEAAGGVKQQVVVDHVTESATQRAKIFDSVLKALADRDTWIGRYGGDCRATLDVGSTEVKLKTSYNAIILPIVSDLGACNPATH